MIYKGSIGEHVKITRKFSVNNVKFIEFKIIKCKFPGLIDTQYVKNDEDFHNSFNPLSLYDQEKQRLQI